MLLSRHQNAGQNLDINIASRCFENVAQFRYLGTKCSHTDNKKPNKTNGENLYLILFKLRVVINH
jgi:hypothetical protein